MPYHVERATRCPMARPYAVLKDDDGRIMGCHATQDDANKQLAALNAAERQADEQREPS